jgi:hypothetical protein
LPGWCWSAVLFSTTSIHEKRRTGAKGNLDIIPSVWTGR